MPSIAIIGGGASGLAAAICAAEHGADVTIYEKNDRVGRKILSTGNGRCNLSNTDMSLSHFRGNHKFISAILDSADVTSFIYNAGIITREENGRLYPYSNHASSVLDGLRFKALGLGVKMLNNCTITKISKKLGRFILENVNGIKYSADRVIIASGGKASPALGSDGMAFKLLASVGHTITPVYPALVQLKCKKEQMKGLKGLRAYANAKLFSDDTLIKEEYGEIQFTDYGLSGIPIFNLSPFVGNLSGKITVSLDLLPQYENVMPVLRGRNPEYLFTGIFQRPLAISVSERAKGAGLSKLASITKDFRFDVIGTMPWENAQVTAGGAVTDEFSENLESRIVSGLYAAGEVLNVDGDCGGYNLHWAWASGIISGRSAAK